MIPKPENLSNLNLENLCRNSTCELSTVCGALLLKLQPTEYGAIFFFIVAHALCRWRCSYRDTVCLFDAFALFFCA